MLIPAGTFWHISERSIAASVTTWPVLTVHYGVQWPCDRFCGTLG